MRDPGALDELPVLARDADARLLCRPHAQHAILRAAVAVSASAAAGVVVVESCCVARIALDAADQHVGVAAHRRPHFRCRREHQPDLAAQPQRVDAGGRRPQARQQAGAGRIAQGRLAMGVREERAAGGELLAAEPHALDLLQPCTAELERQQWARVREAEDLFHHCFVSNGVNGLTIGPTDGSGIASAMDSASRFVI